MAMKIKRVLSKSLSLEDWVEIGSIVRFDGKIFNVVDIKEDGENYKVFMTDGGFTTYDALGLNRPIFAVNAIPVQTDALYEIVLDDVVAVQSEEV